MKVLLVGHSCGPGLGSEPGITWNWARHLSKQHEVWVITRPEYRDRVETYLSRRPNPVACLPYAPEVRKAPAQADLILASNEEARQLLSEAGARRAELFSDRGTTVEVPFHPPSEKIKPELRLLWAGRLEARKAPPLVLESLEACGSMPVKLRVAVKVQ